ncbi:hypothetical protein MMC17_002968 [Xylographa soralifera]|nr:hypothetical protein [Xylographa soralifera]
MYKPTLALVLILSLLVPSLANPDAELLPRQAGANGATAQLSLLSTTGPSASMSSSATPSSSMTTTTTTTVPASVSASISASMASVSASVSLATNAVTGGGSGSGDTGGVGGANSSDAMARGGGRWACVGVVAVVVGLGAVL